MRGHLADTAAPAAAMSRAAPAGLFKTMGQAMTAEDILAVWTVEWTIHQLDLTAFLPGTRPAPLPEAIDLTTSTLDGLLPDGRCPDWDEITYILKGTGRVPLDAADQDHLGDRAAGYPAFG
jgi:hypothetical protein